MEFGILEKRKIGDAPTLLARNSVAAKARLSVQEFCSK